MSVFLQFIFVVGCLFLTSCSTKYIVASNTFIDYQEIPYGFEKGTSFCIVSKNNDNVLFSKEIERKIVNFLQNSGFEIDDSINAKYALLFDFAISSSSQIVNKAKYIPGQTQKTSGSISGTLGEHTLYKENTETSGTTVYVPETQIIFERKLTINVCDNRSFKDQTTEIPIWSGLFVSTGMNSDLREVMDYLLVPAFENFGKNTGKCVKVCLNENDPKIKNLRNHFALTVREPIP